MLHAPSIALSDNRVKTAFLEKLTGGEKWPVGGTCPLSPLIHNSLLRVMTANPCLIRDLGELEKYLGGVGLVIVFNRSRSQARPSLILVR